MFMRDDLMLSTSSFTSHFVNSKEPFTAYKTQVCYALVFMVGGAFNVSSCDFEWVTYMVYLTCVLNINLSLQWMNHLQLRTSVGSWFNWNTPFSSFLPNSFPIITFTNSSFEKKKKKCLWTFKFQTELLIGRGWSDWQATSIDFICLTFKCCSRDT